jgi:hypothetical protein
VNPFKRTKPKMTGLKYANEVMQIINDGTIRLGVWDEITRDVILRSLRRHYDGDIQLDELIVDDGANFRLKPAGHPLSGRVRLADYRMSSIGQPERPDVAAINERLAAIPL